MNEQSTYLLFEIFSASYLYSLSLTLMIGSLNVLSPAHATSPLLPHSSQVDDPPPSSTSASSHRSNMICYNNLCVFKILCLSWIKSGNSNISIFSSWKTCKNNNLRNLAYSTLNFSKIKKSWGAGIWLWWKQVGQHFSVFTGNSPSLRGGGDIISRHHQTPATGLGNLRAGEPGEETWNL